MSHLIIIKVIYDNLYFSEWSKKLRRTNGRVVISE